jgi:hypothetical protein
MTERPEFLLGSPHRLTHHYDARSQAANPWLLSLRSNKPSSYGFAAFWGSSAGFTYVIAKGPIAVTDTIVAPLVAA